MRLLNARTHQLEHVVGSSIPRYAILSHTWGSDEVSLQDLVDKSPVEDKEGYAKIRFTCAQAVEDGLDYAWIDTCCIDRTSSAELSEAINSMFRWYQRAEKCYAFLADVTAKMTAVGGTSSHLEIQEMLEASNFMNSRWFERGWTLQELIAPREVIFFSRDWTVIGTRTGRLTHAINRITGIDYEVLKNPNLLSTVSFAKRMSWAAKRKTTRKEDEAYCLLGIFGVNMAMLYGEEENAFYRLQEEIIRSSTDQSILAWAPEAIWERSARDNDLLAASPAYFEQFADVFRCFGATQDDPFQMTNSGLQITLPLIKSDFESFLGILNCQQGGRLLAIKLETSEGTEPARTWRARIFGETLDTKRLFHRSWVKPVGVEDARAAQKRTIVISRERPSREQTGQPQFRLWLRLLNVDFGSELQLEDVWPLPCWDLSAWEPQTGIEEGQEEFDAFVGKFTPSGVRAEGGILLQHRHVSGLRIVVCFLYDADLPFDLAGKVSLAPSLRIHCPAKRSIQHYCSQLRVKFDATAARRRRTSTALPLGDGRMMTADVRAETALSDYDIVLKVTPSYTMFGRVSAALLGRPTHGVVDSQDPGKVCEQPAKERSTTNLIENASNSEPLTLVEVEGYPVDCYDLESHHQDE